ncbi:hypothetical protein MTO96_025137 [Rhipicephalus appendiculatus]
MAHVLDYVTFLLLTGAGLVVGCYFSFRKKASQAREDEIFLGSKSLHVIPLAASFLATAASATGVVGVPAHMYAYGFHLAWAFFFHIVMIPVAVRVVVPVLYQLNVTSVFQYVRMRYNTPISVITSVTYIILSQMVGAIAIFASSVAVSTVFNASATWCSVIIGLTATAYTAMGGLRGVVWADCLQAVLSLSAPLVIIAKVIWDARNGDARIQPLSEIFTYKYFFNYSFDLTTDETMWAGLLATAPTFFNRICLDQGTAQRYIASRNQKEAKWTAIVGALLTCLFFALVTCAGAALVCRYRGCDPVLSGSIKKVDQLLPFYLLEDFSSFPGLSGTFIAGVVSASISTVSSLVNSQAAVWYFDVITPFCKVADRKVDLIVKALAFAVGGIMTGCSVVVPYMGSVTAMFMAVNAAITGPFVGLVMLGLTVPFANSKGAGSTALLMVVYQLLHMSVRMNFGAQELRMPVSLEFCPGNVTTTPRIANATLPAFSKRSVNTFPLFRLSSYWSSLFSTVTTYIGGIALSLLLASLQ